MRYFIRRDPGDPRRDRAVEPASVDDRLERPHSYPFVMDPRWRPVLAGLRLHTARSGVHVDADTLTAQFGPWTVVTPLDNIADVQVTGLFRAWRALGPRVSLVDRGLTFGTNTAMGVCISFHRPVRGIEPLGLVRHPSLTVAVAEPQVLARQLRALAGGPRSASRANPTRSPTLRR
jgi:hypothetical protein